MVLHTKLTGRSTITGIALLILKTFHIQCISACVLVSSFFPCTRTSVKRAFKASAKTIVTTDRCKADMRRNVLLLVNFLQLKDHCTLLFSRLFYKMDLMGPSYSDDLLGIMHCRIASIPLLPEFGSISF